MAYHLNAHNIDAERHSASLERIIIAAQRQANVQQIPVIITDDSGAIVHTVDPHDLATSINA